MFDIHSYEDNGLYKEIIKIEPMLYKGIGSQTIVKNVIKYKYGLTLFYNNVLNTSVNKLLYNESNGEKIRIGEYG